MLWFLSRLLAVWHAESPLPIPHLLQLERQLQEAREQAAQVPRLQVRRTWFRVLASTLRAVQTAFFLAPWPVDQKLTR